MAKTDHLKDFKFKKGQSGNPGGKPKDNAHIRKFRQMTYKEFIDALHKYGTLTKLQMAEELKKPEATMFELIFGNIVSKASQGDKDARNLLIERLWGKVKESYDLNLNSISEEELLLLGKAAIAEIEGSK